MDLLKWFRRKPKYEIPPPLEFEIPIEALPRECEAAIRAGARVTLRQYPTERVAKYKYRSKCSVFLDGKWAADTELTWEQPPDDPQAPGNNRPEAPPR